LQAVIHARLLVGQPAAGAAPATVTPASCGAGVNLITDVQQSYMGNCFLYPTCYCVSPVCTTASLWDAMLWDATLPDNYM